MRDSLREGDSPRESRERRENQCNAYNAYNAYNDIQEKRDNHCIRLRASIHKAVKQYCGSAQINIGQLYEEAAIMFMEVYPVAGNVLIVDKKDRENNLDDQIDEIILIDELQDALKTLNPERKLHLVKKKKLAKLLKRGRRLNHRGELLEELMKEAIGYLV